MRADTCGSCGVLGGACTVDSLRYRAYGAIGERCRGAAALVDHRVPWHSPRVPGPPSRWPPSCWSALFPLTTTVAAATVSIGTAEAAALTLTNKRRTDGGLVGLRHDVRLARLARERARYMACDGPVQPHPGQRHQRVRPHRWRAHQLVCGGRDHRLEHGRTTRLLRVVRSPGLDGLAEPPGDRPVAGLQLRRLRPRRSPTTGGASGPASTCGDPIGRVATSGSRRSGRRRSVPSGCAVPTLVRQRHPPPGPDRRPPVFPRHLAPRGWTVAEPRHDAGDVPDEVVATRLAIRDPCARA